MLTYVWNFFFSFEGIISGRAFLVGTIFNLGILILLGHTFIVVFDYDITEFLVLYFIFLPTFPALIVKRIHDMNNSGWYSFILYVLFLLVHPINA